MGPSKYKRSVFDPQKCRPRSNRGRLFTCLSLWGKTRQKKGNAPISTLVSSTWAQGKISTISTVSSGQTKNTKTILIFANFKMIVSLIFVIACQTNTWTSTFVFRGLKPNVIFEASSPNVLCLIPSCDLRTIFLFMIFSVKPHHIARTDRNS